MPSRQGRRRIGLLLPSSNTTQEFEFTRIMPDGVTLHVARLPLSMVELSAAVPRNVEDIESESRKLADADVDAIVLSTTAPGFANGIGYDQELIERIETVSGKKATTASLAFIQALDGARYQAGGLRRALERGGQCGHGFVTASGLSVVSQRTLGYVSDLEIGLLDEQTAYDMGIAVDRPDAQAVVLACGNWSTLGIVDRLEAAIGKPVLTTNQVSLWAALRLAGYHAPVFGWGRLLREFMV